MKTNHPPPRPRRGAGKHNDAEALTLEQRAEARKAELEAARIEAARNPDDEEIQARYLRAKRAHAAGMTIDDFETRAIVALDLISSGSTTAAIVSAIREQFDLNDSGARRVLEQAIESMPTLAVEGYRKIAIARLEMLASEARANGDYASATRATISAAKLAGVSEKTEATLTVRHEESDIPKAIAEALNDPRAAEFYLVFGRMPLSPIELSNFKPQAPADVLRSMPLLAEKNQ